MLEELYKHHDQLIAYAKIFDNSYCEDIVSETYIKLHEYSSYDKCFTNGKLNKGYIFVTIRSVYINLFCNKFQTQEIYDIEFNDNDMEKEIEWHEFRTKIENEVNSWEMYDKKLFTIYRDNNISIRKLAAATGISSESIFRSIKSQKEKLREMFKDDYKNLK